MAEENKPIDGEDKPIESPNVSEHKRADGKFKKGNCANPKGRPAGSRNKAMIAMEQLLDGESEEITRTAVALAKAGDGVALRLVMERVLPPRRSRPITVDIPKLDSLAAALEAHARIADSAASGDLTPDEAGTMCGVVDNYVRAFSANELELRLAALEATLGNKK